MRNYWAIMVAVFLLGCVVSRGELIEQEEAKIAELEERVAQLAPLARLGEAMVDRHTWPVKTWIEMPDYYKEPLEAVGEKWYALAVIPENLARSPIIWVKFKINFMDDRQVTHKHTDSEPWESAESLFEYKWRRWWEVRKEAREKMALAFTQENADAMETVVHGKARLYRLPTEHSDMNLDTLLRIKGTLVVKEN